MLRKQKSQHQNLHPLNNLVKIIVFFFSLRSAKATSFIQILAWGEQKRVLIYQLSFTCCFSTSKATQKKTQLQLMEFWKFENPPVGATQTLERVEIPNSFGNPWKSHHGVGKNGFHLPGFPPKNFTQPQKHHNCDLKFLEGLKTTPIFFTKSTWFFPWFPTPVPWLPHIPPNYWSNPFDSKTFWIA